MGNVITRNAGPERIVEAASKTMAMVTARGGDVKALAEGRLSALLSALVSNAQQLDQARSNGDMLHATLMARDSESDLEIGAVVDEIWNTLGRPAQSIDYNLIVGSGKNAWTDGDPIKQPHLMLVLAANIRNSNHPKLQEKKDGWAARLEQRAAAQATAAAPVEAGDAQMMALTMQRRTLANAAQVGLARLKRDLKNLGMTEAQVHEIIPDAPAASAASAATAENAQSAGNNQPAPKAEVVS
jgi:hypothetical protein